MPATHSGSRVEVTVTRVSLPLFIRLVHLFNSQPGLKERLGFVPRWLCTLIVAPLYLLSRRSARNCEVVAARQNGILVGGVLVSASGCLQLACLPLDGRLKREVLEAGLPVLDGLLATNSDRQFTAWTGNPSVERALRRRAFADTGERKSIVTVRLGICSFSYVAAGAPPQPGGRIRVMEVRLLRRRAESGDAPAGL